MLTARYKTVRNDIGRVAHWRALCGFGACPGHLARLDRIPGRQRAHVSKAWDVQVEPGFVQKEPDHWALGSHAEKSRHHAPRRPAQWGWRGMAVRDETGRRFVQHPTQGHWVYLKPGDSLYSKRYPSISRSIGEFTIRDTLFIACPTCGRESAVSIGTVAKLAAALWREEAERHNDQPGAELTPIYRRRGRHDRPGDEGTLREYPGVDVSNV
jgi:hypothetical protein